MVIEGDFLLRHSRYGFVVQPSSVNLEGGSSYVHLDDYIKWNPPWVIPWVFPLMFGHTVTLNLLETLVKVGRARRAPTR